MAFSTLEVTSAGSRARIVLNRPEKLNPLSTSTLQELVDAARLIDSDPEVKVVVFSGNGRAFCAGADLASFSPTQRDGADTPDRPYSARDAADAGRRMAEAIEAMHAVTIVRIHGQCVGGGLVLAAACDLRVAADDARFSIPEVDLGIPLAWGGVPRLVREIGPAMTKELVMTGRSFSAAEAREIGFLNRVVPFSQLDQEVEELAQALSRKSALVLAATKSHTNAVTEGMVGTTRSWNDADSLVTALHDPESRAAAAAYLQQLRDRK
jgi:enoyl-CoA hydratase/carnithine racemase